MKHFQYLAILLLALSGTLFTGCEHNPGLNGFNWILGVWEVQNKDTTTFEIWEPVNDTLYEGFNFQVLHGDTTIKEHLWLQSAKGEIKFSAKVYGHNENRRVYFTLTHQNMNQARFENKNHDFPTMIQYTKSGVHYVKIKYRNEDVELPEVVMEKVDS
ncbi:hypothetical protein KFE98_19375 [bacterium SCSIO 12741]|nr:hypothetical protein KFE98_19375 [bacterium SCSIO 12741]